ncbi:MAG: EamA family transporter [Spirochaetales bacterium]|nr:EamA family transporter [Spirochaetales bacterium]
MRAEYLLLILMPVLVTAGQLLLKKNTYKIVTDAGLISFFHSLLVPGIILGAAGVVCAPLLYIKALGAVPLSEAFAFNSLNYIFVFLSGHFLLKEDVNAMQVAGVVLISAGFLLPFASGALGA